ncbi:Putative ankyrin repeat protein, partial [Giardia duodenalis]
VTTGSGVADAEHSRTERSHDSCLLALLGEQNLKIKMLAGEADTQQAASVAEMLPPNLGKIIRQSQQDTQESRVRSRPSSTRQGFVVAEQRLRENADYRVLCGICRRWGDREHLNAHDGFTPQLKLSGSSGFNCQTKIGRARTARMIETIILHLPVSLTECLSICHDSVDWVAGRIADSCRYFESWFPASFMALINEKAEMMGREKLFLPQDSPEDVRDDEDWSIDINTGRAQSKKWSKELYSGAKTPSIDFYDDTEDISARDLLAKLTAEQASQEQQANQIVKPHVYHQARSRPGFSYNFVDRTKDFYLNSRCPHGEAQQILSDAANEAIYGARQPILNHTPMRPASQQLTRAEQIIYKTVYSKPTRIIDQAPKNIKPLTAPYTSSLDAARHRYELYKNILASGDRQVNTAGRTFRSMNSSSVRLAEEALHLNELEAEIKMNVKAYHEGRVRAKSVHGTMVESRRYGATGFKEVQMGRGIVVVPDYFTPQTRRHTKALYEQYNNEYDFSTTEIDQPDELLDFNEDFTGLGIAKLNQSKLRALAGIVTSPKYAETEEGADGAQGDESDNDLEDSDDSVDKAKKRSMGKNGISAANAFIYRKAIAEYVTSQVNLPQYDNKLQPMIFPQDTEKSGAFYSSPQQSMAAAGDLKTKDLLSGGKHGFDPRLYQVLDASKNILNNEDLLLDSDSEDNLGRRPAKALPDQHLYEDLYLDSDPSDPDAPAQEDKIEAPELSFVRESVILEGVRDTLAPIADITKDPKGLLITPDPVGPLIMKQAASMKAKAIKAEVAAREEQAALAAKLAREKARKAAEANEKTKNSKGTKAPKVKKQSQGSSVTDTMSKYTASGAPISYETIAADTYKAAATVEELAQNAEAVRSLADAEIERSKQREEAFVEKQRVEMRKTAAFNGLTEACKKVAERTGDLNSMRTAGITHVAKAHLGNTVFYKPGLERYERQRLSDEEAEDNSAITTKIDLSLKPYLYDNSKTLEKLSKITEITSTPLRKEDDGTVPLFERTYQPINAASRKPGCTDMTLPYIEQPTSAPSLFQRTMMGRHLSGMQFKEDMYDYTESGCVPPFAPDIGSVASTVTAEVSARNAQRTKPLPQPNRKEIRTFFDDRAINTANPQTQVFKMQSIETDSSLKVDGAVASAQNIASLFTLNTDKNQKLNAALVKRDLARRNADAKVMSSSGLDESTLPDIELGTDKAAVLSTASPSRLDGDSAVTEQMTPLIAQADRTVALAGMTRSVISEYKSHASEFQQERLASSVFGRPAVLPSMSLIGRELARVKDNNLLKDLQQANISVIPSRNATVPALTQRDNNPTLVNIASIMSRMNTDPCPREITKKEKKGKKSKKGKKGTKGSNKK